MREGSGEREKEGANTRERGWGRESKREGRARILHKNLCLGLLEGRWVARGRGEGEVSVCRDVKQNEPVLLSYYQGAGNQETVVRTVPERLSCETRQGISKEYLT